MAVLALALPAFARAGTGPWYFSTAVQTPPAIDGTLAAGEWDNALPYQATFGNFPATIRFEHDANTLYVAVSIVDANATSTPSLGVYFDNNDDGTQALGDDSWNDFVGSPGTDWYWDPVGIGPGGPSHYGDSSGGGTNETTAAGTLSGGVVTYEFAHPLCSADTAHDICIHAGQTAGVDFQYDEQLLPGVFYNAPGANSLNASDWGNLHIGRDTTHPDGAITQPAAGTMLRGTVPVTATATDDTGVKSVEFKWFDGATGQYYPVGTVTAPPYSISFDTTQVPDTTPVNGNPWNATLYAVITDVAGNNYTLGYGMAVDNSTHLGTLHGSLDNDYVFLIGFSPGTHVDLTVKTPTADVPVAFSAVTDASGKATIGPDGRWDLVRGTVLTASVPNVGTKTLTLVDIGISSVDTFKNAVFGKAPPFASVRVFLFSDGTQVASATATATRSGTWSAVFDHATAAGMLVMADTDFGDTDGDRSRADFTIPAPATGASISVSGNSSAAAGAASAPIASIPLAALAGSSAGGPAGSPLAGIPLAGIPLAGIPLAGIPLAGIPLAGIGFTAADLTQNGLGGVPLSTIPLNPPDSWEARLAANPSFASDPPQSVTLAQVVGTSVTAGLTLADVDVSASPLAGIPLAGIALGGMPLAGIPLAGIGATGTATLQAWCDYINSQPGYSCTGGSTLSGQTVMGLALSGVPLAGIPLAGIPLAGIDLTGSPLAGIPLAGIDIADSPLAGIPLAGIDMSASPLAGIPLAGIPLAGIGNVVDCALLACAAPGSTTLGQAAAANELKAGATLGDLRYLCVPGSPGDSHCNAGDKPILLADFVKGLPHSATVADLLAALMQKGTYAWESLPLPQFPIQDYSQDGGVVHYTVTFTVTSASPGNQPATVSVGLPAGARYVAGSSQLGGATVTDPVWDTSSNGLTWQVTVPANAAQTLAFAAKPGLVLGKVAATAKIASGALSGVSADVPASTAITPTFTGNSTAATAQAIAPDTLYFGYTPNGNSRSYFTVPLPDAAGTQVTVHLSHLHVDDDLVVYGPAPAPLRTPRPSTTATLVPGVVPALSQQTQPIAPEALSDVPIAPPPGASVLGISDNRGLANEDVSFIVPEHSAGASATIQVSSFDGGYSDQPWMLRVEQSPPLPLPATCATTPLVGGGTTEPSPGSVGGSTLYLFNSKRYGDLYGATAEQSVWTKLTTLAGRTDAAGGTVIPVDGVPSVAAALNAWYTRACSPTSSNDVVRAIGSYLDTIAPTYKYVVIVGGYDVLPPGLVLDNTTSVNERGYATTFLGGSNNQYLSAYALGYLPTDDPYGDTNYSGTGAYVPEAAVGRLVETPAQIGAQIDQYVTLGGGVNPTTALVTGYDFMTDGAQQIAANLQPNVPAPASLINETWTRQQLLAALFPTSGAPPAIDSLNAHYDHHRALPANENAAGTESNLLTTADVAASSTPGRVVITMGCHSGVAVSDLLYGPSLGQDWAETYAAGGAVDFVGNTGYGLGETAGVAYSEQLQALLAQRLNGALTVGQALTYAKQEYAASVPTTSGYQLKVLDEANMFGLPMYRVGTGTIAPPTAPAPVVPDPVTGLSAMQFNLSPTYTLSTASTGGYYTTGGSAAYEDRRPIEPLVKLDVTEPSLVAHGALITGLTSTEQPGFDAAFSRVVDDTSALAPELVGDATYPSKLQTISTFTTPNGTRQRLLLFGGQFRSGALDARGTGTQRLFTSLAGVVLYAPPSVTDFEAPTFGPVVASSSAASTVAFAVNVSDNSGNDAVKRVVALYRDSSGTWRSVDLSRSGTTARWSGTGPLAGTTAEWFIQAVDTAGNVGVTSNKAVVESTAPPVATGGISAAVTGPSTNGWYTGAATVTLTGASDITASVDGGAFTPTASVSVDGTGVHTLSYQGTDSSGAAASGSLTLPIDETPPTISIQSGIISATTKPQVVCADAGSGIASCVTTPSTLDTSLGQHSVHVVATDRVGNVTQQDGTYTVDLFSGFLQPVDNVPTLNVVKVGSAVPVKFGLGLNMGLSIFQAGYPLTRAIDCQSDAPLDSIETTLTAGSSSLQYDATSNQYTYVWKTSSTWAAGSCRQLVLRLVDGTEHVANFKFK